MNKPFFFIFQPIRTPSFLKLFLFILVLLVCIVFIFIRPDNLEQSDFMLIAWYPGQQLLHTGFVDANYPYPLWTVIVMLPLVVWAPKTAMLLMFVCNMLMLSASLTLFVLIFKWELSPVLLVLYVFISVLFLPVLSSLWLGQLTIFSLLILMLILYFYLNKRWGLLGFVIGLSFIKPQVLLLLAGSLLFWSLWKKQWMVWRSFIIVIASLVLASIPFVSTPLQIIGGGINGHLETYIRETSTIWGVFMGLGQTWVLPFLISFALLIWLAWEWLKFVFGITGKYISPVNLFLLTVIINLIVIPYSWMHNLILLLPSLGYFFTSILKSQVRQKNIWIAFLFFIMYPLPIILFIVFMNLTTVQIFQIVPVLILLPFILFFEYYYSLNLFPDAGW